MNRPRQDFLIATTDAQVSALLLDAEDLEPNAGDLAEAPRGQTREAFLRRRAETRRRVAERLGVSATEVEVRRDLSGAPRVLRPETPLCLSVSGRADFCAIGLGSHAIGVDIEPLERSITPVWSALHAREKALLQALPSAAQGEGFLRLWTAKEAYLKALGSGFAREPAGISVDLDFRLVEGERQVPLTAGEWRVVTLEGREFLIACVVLGG